MKRILSIGLILLLIWTIPALAAEIPPLSDDLFSCAKKALQCLDCGAYEELLTVLPFSSVAPAASEWQNFSEGNFASLGNGVQSDYAVAYWTGNAWKIAVPIREPSDPSVEALVLTSSDGVAFSGYSYAQWGKIEEEYRLYDSVCWNAEYVSSESLAEAD